MTTILTWGQSSIQTRLYSFAKELRAEDGGATTCEDGGDMSGQILTYMTSLLQPFLENALQRRSEERLDGDACR